MQSKFFVFSSVLELAHAYWEKILEEGDTAIDATCGNGKDTLKLASLLTKGKVIALDIQEAALEKTKDLLSEELLTRVTLLKQSHETFPPCQAPIKLIIYNLGYLPGGDKTLTTHTNSTLISVENAVALIADGGAVSITCYPGHEEGRKEEEALLAFLKVLDPKKWNVCHHRLINRLSAPSLIFIQKNI